MFPIRRHSFSPIAVFALFTLVFSVLGPAGPAEAFSYTVRAGDTLFKLSQRFGVPLATLQRVNNNWDGYLEVGQVITIPDSPPTPSPPPAPATGTTYTVQTGDSLFLIARRFGISVSQLQAANKLWSDTIYPGQVLVIPQATTPGGNSGGTGAPGGTRYTVQYGDTLFLIARRFGTSASAIQAANGLSSSLIYPGQVLVIPTTGTEPPGSTPNGRAPSSPRLSLSWNDQDLLARLVHAEAGAEPFEGQVAVAATVLNRLEDPRYPKSIPGIIYQKVNGYYQYEPVMNGLINQPASALSLEAVKVALSGHDPSLGATGFYNPAKVSPTSWVVRQPVTVVIGNHVFIKP